MRLADRQLGNARARGGIRVLRTEDMEQQVARRMRALALAFDQRQAERSFARFARALRAERRARGRHDYDPLRHLALARFVRLLRSRRRGK
jgi:hypothetical protein